MIVGLLLAAGESKRFHLGNKLLYKIIPGKTVLDMILDSCLNSKLDKIVIVVGYQRKLVEESIEEAIDLADTPVKIIYNEEYQMGGMSSSVIKGLELINDVKAVVITPADIPFISSTVIDKIIDRFHIDNPKIIVPTYKDRKGHPILLNSALIPEARTISSEKQGLKEITRKYRNETVFLPTQEKGILRDIDSPKDLEDFI
jgi:molybdenum cofactor cytidylyltransferase